MDGLTIFKRVFPFAILSLVLISGCNNQKEYHTKPVKQPPSTRKEVVQEHKTFLTREKSAPTITVWVHGTRAASRILFPNFFRSIAGLHHASVYNAKNNLFNVANYLNSSDPDQFPYEDIYMFGWSGKLSATTRKQSAEKLYEELLELVDEYTGRYGVAPKVRIITHSHGGNVAMYLAEARKEHPVQLNIDELILLACPVQKRTMHLLKDPIFTQIYSFYSKQDVIQVLDPQGVYEIKEVWNGTKKRRSKTPFFSQRRFPAQDNLEQVQVKLTGWRIIHPHLQFILEKFIRSLPKILNDLRNGKADMLAQKFQNRIKVVEFKDNPELPIELI